MTSTFEKFKALHHGSELFVLPNAWDARSATLLQQKRYPAIATSSAAVANALGYDDGEKMPFTDYLFVINRILSTIKVPLTVDIEMGYGKTNEAIYSNVLKLAESGVAGINIEDSIITGTTRLLQDSESFARKIEFIKNKLETEKLNLFVNIRCDTYILNVDQKEKETLKRINVYNTTGADGIFLPCISNEDDIAEAIAHTRLPLNVMVISGLPDIITLNKLGVKRVSMGPFMFQKVYHSIGDLSDAIATTQNFSPIL